MDIKPNESSDKPSKESGIYPRGGALALIAGFDTRDTLRRWWIVMTQPRVATYDTQQSGASWPSVIIQLAILGVLDAIAAVLVIHANILVIIVANILSAYIGFFLFTVLYFACARLLGGNGAFLTYTYVLALIYVPLQILGTLLGIIPTIGILLLLALSIYQLILSVYATSSVHHLTIAKATIAVLVPFVLLLILSSVLANATGLAFFGL